MIKIPHKVLVAGRSFLLAGLTLYSAVWHPVIRKPVKGKRVIACVGDSLTFGIGCSRPMSSSYPAVLKRLLAEKFDDIDVMNYGLSSRTLLVEGNFPYVHDRRYKRTFRDDPFLYIVMLGSNDAKPYNFDPEKFEDEYTRFLKKYISVVGSENVIVMKPPRAFAPEGSKAPLYDIKDENIIKEGEIIDTISAKLGISSIDLYALTKDHPEYYTDGVHLNETGYELAARHIMDAVLPLL